MDYLATVTRLDVFGSEVDLVHLNTQEYPEGQIWDALQVNTSFNLIVREWLEVLVYQSKADFEDHEYQDYPKAVKVPVNSGIIPDSAFCAVPRLRRVLVEEGLHTESLSCRQLYCALRKALSGDVTCLIV